MKLTFKQFICLFIALVNVFLVIEGIMLFKSGHGSIAFGLVLIIGAIGAVLYALLALPVRKKTN